MKDQDLSEIKKWLEKGDIARLAAQAGITRQHAYNILANKKTNMKFIETAMELALANKARISGGIDRLKRLSA